MENAHDYQPAAAWLPHAGRADPFAGGDCRDQATAGQQAAEPAFIFGINSNLRIGDLLALRVGTVRHLGVGQELVMRESKTGKLRRITLNRAVVEAVRPGPTSATPTRCSPRAKGAAYLKEI